MAKYYLAYGSNLNLDQMARRCRFAKKVGYSTLKNYRLVFKGSCDGFSYLTIEKCEGSNVPVGIFKINFLDEYCLDRYEGYPGIYHKKLMRVNLNGQDIKGLIYIMNPEFDYGLPSRSYFLTCYIGYLNFSFDKDVLFDALSYTKQQIKKEETRYLKKLHQYKSKYNN